MDSSSIASNTSSTSIANVNLDDAVNFEENCFEIGREAGRKYYEHDAQSLELGSYSGGMKGFMIGFEIGFFHEFSTNTLKEFENHSEKFNENTEKEEKEEKETCCNSTSSSSSSSCCSKEDKSSSSCCKENSSKENVNEESASIQDSTSFTTPQLNMIKTSRTVKRLNDILKLTSTFPTFNDPECDIENTLTTLRALYRQSGQPLGTFPPHLTSFVKPLEEEEIKPVENAETQTVTSLDW